MSTGNHTPQDPDVSARFEALKAEAAVEVAAKTRADDQARQARREKEAPTASRATAKGPWWAPLFLLRVMVLVVLPFVVLVGGSVWLYRGRAMPTWVALGLAGLVAAAMLTYYGARISKSLTGQHKFRFVATKIALPLVLFYCGYSLLYLSSVNAKTDDVRNFYTSVHPLLRVALSTAILADGDIVVTDAARVAEDYERMGLPVYENSLHFEQPDGYVHAVDLRTMGRSQLANRLMTTYFRLMGFRTLRHVGTADHLHVSLPLN